MDKIFITACKAICQTRCENYRHEKFYSTNYTGCACGIDNTKCVLCQSYLREYLKNKEENL